VVQTGVSLMCALLGSCVANDANDASSTQAN
jgi:hypothetical protein